MDAFSQIRELLEKDEIDDAFNKFQALALPESLDTEIAGLKGRFSKLKKDIRSGLISIEPSKIERNQIRVALLELTKEIRELDHISVRDQNENDLSDNAKTILFEVSRDQSGQAKTYMTKEGWEIQVGNKSLFSNGNTRERIAWQDAVNQLLNNILIKKLDTINKYSEIYEITTKGFQVADHLSIKDSSSKKEKFGFYTDPRDGQAYKTISLAGKLWLAENLNFDVGEDCWHYDNDPKHGQKYGRLYTWDAAFKACPPGWRLPRKEEFEDLIRNFGGGSDAYHALIDGGFSGFNALFSGIRFDDGDFESIGKYTSFWTDKESEIKDGKAYFFYVKPSGSISWYINFKAFGHSVRCIRDH